MTRIATTPGLFPLPDWAKTDLIELKGKQKEDLIGGDEGAGITEIYDRAREELIQSQNDRGLDRIVEGQLRWDDMLCHPLAVHEAVETGGLLRYYDNNNFYREAIVRDSLEPDGDVATELEQASDHTDHLQAVLPGPYSLGELATDEYYGSTEAFRDGLAEFLGAEIQAFPSVDTLFLLEPSLATHPPDSVERVLAAIDTIGEAARNAGIADVLVHSYWDVPPADVYSGLLGLEGIGIGLDLVANEEDALDRLAEQGCPDTLALGVIDGQNTRLETRTEIDALVSRAEEAANGLERVYLSTNTELFYLPVNRALDKLELLGQAAEPAEVAT